jgi:PAS domain S-box-containing protein
MIISTELMQQELSSLRQQNVQLKSKVEKLTHTVSVLENVIYSITDPIFVKDEQHRWIVVNDAFCKFLGYEKSELLGKSDYDVFPKEQADVFWEKDEAVLVSGLEICNEEYITASDGTTRIISTKKNCFQRQNGQKLLVGTFRDITANKQVELRLREAKAELESRVIERTIELQKTVTQLQQEIRDRQQIETTLRAQEQFLRSIYEGVENNIFVYEVVENSGFRLLGWNSPTERSTGFSVTQVVGKTLQEIFGNEEGHAIQQKFERCLQAGTAATYEECRTFQGQESWWLTTLNPLKNSQGQIYRLVGTTFNISDRKRAEEQLRHSEQRFRDVSEAAGEYLWEMDANGLYTFVTEKAKLVKGYAPSELLGHSPFEFMPTEDVVKVQGILQAASTQKSNFKLEHRNITPTGEIVWEEANGVPLLNQAGDIEGFRGTGLSITERKQAELQLRQSEAKLRRQAKDLAHTLRELQRTQAQLIQSEKMSSLGQLVAGVAHEINNPVNFIYGNLIHANEYVQDLLKLLNLYQKNYPHAIPEIQETAEAVDLDFLMDDLPKLITSMRVGAERIQRIVASLRNFSRMDQAEVKEVDIHEGIESTLMILQNRLKLKSNRAGSDAGRSEIQVIKEYGKLPLVECFAGQLNQVFMNILSNAIDALEERETQQSPEAAQHNPGTITICTQINEHEQVEIRIADNGMGMSDRVLNQLFDPFFTTKPVGKGTGMGLSISYQIITERHHGSLRCSSAPGQGAEFIIEIPIRRTAQE